MAKSGQELVYCSLGGAGEIGMNLNLFGYGKPGEYKWIIVDIGVTFSDDNIPGIEVILPNPEFIANKKEKVRGIPDLLVRSDYMEQYFNIEILF